MASSPSIPVPGVQEPRPAPRGLNRLTARLGPEHVALLGVLTLSGVLDIHRLSQNGWANVYYAAGVRSQISSLHDFLYVAFDRGGLMMMDKPPIAMWLQDLSAKLFGYVPMSLLLPEAIAGVLSVAALYVLVSRRLGSIAGLLAGLVLAAFPSFVAVSRNTTPDAVLVLLLILSCWAALHAIESGRLRSLTGCAVLVGLAFNTKTLAAYLVVPGIALGYLVCAPGSWQRRLGQLAVAGVLMGLVSAAWLSFVDLTPSSQRPFVGDTTGNSEFELTFNYNGFGRVGGQVGGPGRVPHVRKAGAGVTPGPRREPGTTIATGTSNATSATGKHGPIVFAGSPSPLRVFGPALGDQAGWLVPFAIAGALGLALTARGRGDPRLASSVPNRGDPRLAFLLVLGGWFLAELTLLDFSKGIVHPYYASALGPPLAAMAGGGVPAMAELGRRGGWRLLLPLGAAAASVAVQLVLARREHFWTAYAPLLVVGALGSLFVLVLRPHRSTTAVAASLGFLIVLPLAYSATVWDGPVNGTFPAAGRNLRPGAGVDGRARSNGGTDVPLMAYVRSHAPGRRWEVLTVSTQVADPLVIYGLRAGSMAGYGGTDPVLDGPGLARLVERGDARYVELGGVYADRGGNAATQAVLRACRKIPGSVWRDGVTAGSGLTLWDCAGRTSRLAAPA